MKTLKLKKESRADITMTKEEKQELKNRHIDRKLQRWDFLTSMSWESIYYGFSHINFAYLVMFTFFNFIIFRYMSNQSAYYLASILSCIGSLVYADHKYGHVE